MLNIIAKSLLKLFGWRIDIKLPEEKKFVLIGAPHTSNWDFPLAILTFWTLDRKIKWVGKIQMFRGPLHYLFTALGGIPVDRSSSHGFIEQIVDKIKQSDEMVLTIAPEGTRSKTRYWKSGFYHIALAAGIPICLGYIDYPSKKIGFEKLVYPTGDIETDMKLIAEFYGQIKGRLPANQGPVQIRSARTNNR
jgi:1-acyl-sn-glycerol-3-phosphate acyltransferase